MIYHKEPMLDLWQDYQDYIEKFYENGNYCRCPNPMIRCDDRGCHCQFCGGYEKTLPDIPYQNYLELRVKTQDNKITKIQTKLDDIKIWFENTKNTTNDQTVMPAAIWTLLLKLGENFGNKS